MLIDVEERVAIAVVEIGGRTRGMDAEGVVFRDYREAAAGLPRVQTSTDTGSDALREAAAVVAALPAEIAGRVDHVEVATVDQISLVLRDGRTVVWGSAEESEAEGRGPGRAAPAAGARRTTSACPASRPRPADPIRRDFPRDARRVCRGSRRARCLLSFCNARLT